MSDFYRLLPEGNGFAAAFDDSLYRHVPEDWIVAATDVTNSTEAIEAGHYKDVTIAGALGTIALANHLGSLDFPFFFGGDGMLFLLPPEHREAPQELLEETRQMVARIAGLNLRVAVFPVSRVCQDGTSMEVAKVRLSENYVQAVGRGPGFARADYLLKHGEAPEATTGAAGASTPVAAGTPAAGTLAANASATPTEAAATTPATASAAARADFRGFSCRWQDIPSHRGETLSLIVEETTAKDSPPSLQEIVAQIHSRLEDLGGAHPVRGMGKELRRVRQDNIRNADVQKLDGTLKMVLSVTTEERRRIIQDMDRHQRSGSIFYGYHLSDRAIMTCLIHLNQKNEVHFVDAADGGYAMAARMIKAQRAAWRG